MPVYSSNNTTSNTHADRYNGVESTFIIITMVVMSLISTFGNFMVFVAYMKVKLLQRATNYFILSLATADIFVATFVVNIHTMYMIIGWPFTTLNYGVCLLWLSVDYWVFQVSVFGIILVAGDRYLSIKYPIRYRIRRTDRTVKNVIAANWVISFFIWVPLILVFGFVNGTEEEMIRTKSCDVGSAKIIPATVIGCCVSYVLPVFVVVYLVIDSVRILLNLKTLSVTKKKAIAPSIVFANPYASNSDSPEITTTGCHNLHIPVTDQKGRSQSLPSISINTNLNIQNTNIVSNNNNIKQKIGGSRSQTLSKNLSDYQWIATFNILLGVSFVVNILPFGVLAVTRSICMDIYDKSCVSQEMWYFGYIMCYLNSMLNPICYAFGNKNFKRAFKLVFCGKKERHISVCTLASKSIRKR